MADLEVSTIDRVTVARVNRPEKKNALSPEMLDLRARWNYFGRAIS